MDRITNLSARHVRQPLKEPFETAKRRAEASDTVIVEISLEGGIVGCGAATPVQYVTAETIESVVSAVNAAAPALVGCQARPCCGILHKLAEVLPHSPSARAGVEIALVDAVGKLLDVPSYTLFGGLPLSVETDITIPVVPPEHAGELASEAALGGFRFFKVKVGSNDPEEDFARVMTILKAAPGARLVLDANQGFLPEDAIAFVERLTAAGAEVAIFEQPVEKSDYEGLRKVTQSLSVPVFADESVCSPTDVVQLAAMRAVGGVNVKLMKSGFLGALQIAAICRESGLGLMLGCMLEPRVGITAALHVACAAGNFRHFDLDADLLLAPGSSGGFERSGAWIRPTTSPGLDCPSAH